ncbi:hypothetical protein SORBI_3008G003300 [Sorghum bicolor]|uniref:Uncharacterized protein n=1 Tax=Sorghum bicolor TaxID=4558 RepID=A0A1Z5R460_SORBI|nr:hypothetical protein SORBI_3008G003300 [Sorghum bicolor]
MDAPLSGSGSRRVAAHFRSRFRWQITVVVTQIQMVQQELEGVIEESWRGNISVVCLSIFSVLIWFLVS